MEKYPFNTFKSQLYENGTQINEKNFVKDLLVEKRRVFLLPLSTCQLVAHAQHAGISEALN